MKVVYKKKVSELIREEIIKAEELNKKIEAIILTQKEYDSLTKELRDSYGVRSRFVTVPSQDINLFCGVTIKVDTTEVGEDF